VQRIREVKNKCYSLVLDDRQLADLAFQGLLPHIRDKYASQEFESLSHLVPRISDQDIKPFEPKRAWNKKVSFVDEAASSDSDEEPVIGLAEWVKNKKSMSCPFGHKEPEKFAFDITKAGRIIDFLLQEGQIKLSPNHVILLTPFLGTCPGWQERVAVQCGLLMRMVADEGEVECD